MKKLESWMDLSIDHTYYKPGYSMQ